MKRYCIEFGTPTMEVWDRGDWVKYEDAMRYKQAAELAIEAYNELKKETLDGDCFLTSYEAKIERAKGLMRDE